MPLVVQVKRNNLVGIVVPERNGNLGRGRELPARLRISRI
jgi:hypothetical protein